MLRMKNNGTVCQDFAFYGGNSMQNFSKKSLTLLGTMILAFTTTTLAQTNQTNMGTKQNGAKDFVILSPSDIQWQNGPDSLPAGAQYIVLATSPKSKRPSTLRIKLPANYQIPPYYQTIPVRLTVLSGTLNMGMGNKFDTNNGTALVANSFVSIPARKPHFEWTTEETIIQVSANGPINTVYVNPSDDPRKQAKMQPTTTQPQTSTPSPSPSPQQPMDQTPLPPQQTDTPK